MTATVPYCAPQTLVILLRVICILALLAGAFAYSSAPPRASADEANYQEALDRINNYRSWIGIEPLRMDPALMDAAQSHADYFLRNSGNMPGLHNQTPGAPGFTGATMSDRASAFGYEGSINENIGLSGSILSTVDWSIATINHRLTLIDPRYTDIGFGTVKTETGGMEVIKLGTRSWSNTADPAWQAWPVDGASDIGLQYQGSAPSPFANVPYPVGYPITLKYHGDGTVQFNSAELSANGSSVSILAEAGDGWLTRSTMMILATEPLLPGTQYDVMVQATLNGDPVTHSWSFQTGSDPTGLPQHVAGSTDTDNHTDPGDPANLEPPENDLPNGLADLDVAVQETWAAADSAVNLDEIDRSWLWGPDTFASLNESYSDSPDGERKVAYFDKSRMEINNPNGDRSSKWYVTNGLLVRDMIRGSIQVGDHEYVDHEPAQIALAGDHLETNPDAPTYASLREHSAVNGERREPDRTGEAVMTRLTRNGSIHHGPEVPEGVHYAQYDDVTGYNIASVFWDEISTAVHYDWIYAVGHPISDPHWVYTRVDGVEQWVLVQAFQRRLLTFTPGNDEGWQVEMGNVGRHYYTWRYGEAPPH